MVNIKVPEVLTNHQQLKTDDISFVHYKESAPVGRNLVTFGTCAISFILSGQKEFYGDAESTFVNDHEGIIISDGNALIAERKLHAAQYSSLVVFFPAKIAKDFIASHADLLNHSADKKITAGKRSFLKFTKTPYLAHYINVLIPLIDKQISVPGNLLRHKLDELLLALIISFPVQFLAMFRPEPVIKEHCLRQTVENNLLNNLTINELAFLCNRSLASFKRDFEKEYGMPPGKYIRDRKLDIARHELIGGNSPGNLYIQLGYDNASNFTGAFKKRFGQTPKVYQQLQQQLN